MIGDGELLAEVHDLRRRLDQREEAERARMAPVQPPPMSQLSQTLYDQQMAAVRARNQAAQEQAARRADAWEALREQWEPLEAEQASIETEITQVETDARARIVELRARREQLGVQLARLQRSVQ